MDTDTRLSLASDGGIHLGLAVCGLALDHHLQKVVSGEVRQTEHFFGSHTQLMPYLLNGFALVQQSF